MTRAAADPAAPAAAPPADEGLRARLRPTLAKGIALGMLVMAGIFAVAALDVGLWKWGMPGGGLMAFVACLALAPIAVVLMLEKPEADAPMAPELRDEADAPMEARLEAAPLLTGLAFCAYVAGVWALGLVVPTLVGFVLWARLLYARGWAVSLAAAVGSTIGVVVLFVHLLGMPLPLWPA